MVVIVHCEQVQRELGPVGAMLGRLFADEGEGLRECCCVFDTDGDHCDLRDVNQQRRNQFL